MYIYCSSAASVSGRLVAIVLISAGTVQESEQKPVALCTVGWNDSAIFAIFRK